MTVKLTKAQRCLLERAQRSPDGNPWPAISASERSGGAIWRMFDKMKVRGWFDGFNYITPEGRAALSQAEKWAANTGRTP